MDFYLEYTVILFTKKGSNVGGRVLFFYQLFWNCDYSDSILLPEVFDMRVSSTWF